MEKSLITGITGQDGYYLSKYLLEKGEEVIGLKRRTATDTTQNLLEILHHPKFTLIEGDVNDMVCVYDIINKYRPTHIYNLAAQSHVGTSFKQPFYTIQTDLMGPLNFLESIRRLSDDDYNPRFYQASTSEMFGQNFDGEGKDKHQGINTRFSPQSPYGVAKQAAHELVRIYRQAYGVFACSGILHNHESPNRGELFLTRKVTKYVAKLYNAKRANIKIPPLELGNLDSYRDWSFAGDMVRAMRLMLEQETPQDFVVSSDEAHSVREFVKLAFEYIGENYEDHVIINPEFFRPSEVDYLCGKSDEIRALGWKPEVNFKQLVSIMVGADIARISTVH